MVDENTPTSTVSACQTCGHIHDCADGIARREQARRRSEVLRDRRWRMGKVYLLRADGHTYRAIGKLLDMSARRASEIDNRIRWEIQRYADSHFGGRQVSSYFEYPEGQRFTSSREDGWNLDPSPPWPRPPVRALQEVKGILASRSFADRLRTALASRSKTKPLNDLTELDVIVRNVIRKLSPGTDVDAVTLGIQRHGDNQLRISASGRQ